jgi:hypothetical protein
VLGAGINVDRVFLVVGFQRRLVGPNAFVDVLVVLRVMQEQRRFDRSHHLDRDLRAVVRHRGGEIGAARRHAVDDAASEAEADGADLAG